jgi:ribonucleoside-diphosphate reductase alpha chain
MGEIYVIKRNGKKELLDYEKINTVLTWACEDINNVSPSDVAMNAHLQLYDGITTSEIHKVLVQSAADMISEKTPNYQYVASNLLNFFIRKNIFGVQDNLPHLSDVINLNIKNKVYDPMILEKYDQEDINKINKLIRHKRDYNFTYAGLQQLIDKYLLKDRYTGEVFETPQYMYMLISMTLFSHYKGKERLKRIKSFYNDISLFKISLPTPIMAGVRTPTRQYSSCTLIDVDDTIQSIYNSNTAIGYYTARRAGIGINLRIRSAGDKIRNGEVIHTGVIPFLKMYESTVKSCTQNGIRGGCLKKDTLVKIVDKIEINGKIYDINDSINIGGEILNVRDLL